MSLTLLTHLKNGPITSKATTQRTNFNFNSFCKFNGEYLAAGTNGLFKLGGDTDNGVNIDAYFVPIVTDFGSSSSKRMQYVNVSYSSPGSLYVSLSPDEDDPIEYDVSGAKAGFQRLRVKVAERPKGVFWGYEFGNVDGADFQINRVDVVLINIASGNRNM